MQATWIGLAGRGVKGVLVERIRAELAVLRAEDLEFPVHVSIVLSTIDLARLQARRFCGF
jgi:hypothetical protein